MSNVTQDFAISPAYCEKYCHGKAWPLPKLATHEPVPDKYEVVIAGAGPAGLFLKLLLARYGVGDESVLCVDPKPRPTDTGHADGLLGRSMEILATLGLEHEFLREGRQVLTDNTYTKTSEGLKKAHQRPFYFCPTRYGQLYTMHKGRIERVFLQDLQKYSKACVEYGSAVIQVTLDELDSEYPVLALVQTGEHTRKVRAKYVIGADGAHSAVRRDFDIKMEGDAKDKVWGVVDFVPDSSLKTIRQFNRVTLETGQMASMIIPRERMSDGNWLLRVYTEMPEDQVKKDLSKIDDIREQIRRKKAATTIDHIFERIQDVYAPYYIRVKEGTQPIWWTTYGVGQRLAERFIVSGANNHPRVFLIGDACHTHSPLQGQGMNTSIADAYWLSWRIAYVLLGLTTAPTKLLQSYEDERRPWAEKVVFADKRWNETGMSWDQIWAEVKSQASGCGLEEVPGFLVSDKNNAVDFQGKDLLDGALKTGRRLLNTKVTRWADGHNMDIHDEFRSDGRYRVLVLASKDFPHGRSRMAIEKVCSLTKHFPQGVVDLVVAQPNDTLNSEHACEWDDMPQELVRLAEMKIHHLGEEAYQTYCVSSDEGAVAMLRPDGIVCITTTLEEVSLIEDLLRRVLQPVDGDKLVANGVSRGTGSR